MRGQKLGNSDLTGGKADTVGTFSWKDGNFVPVDTGTYPVVFMPEDKERYFPVELEVTVQVMDPESNPDSDSIQDAKPDPDSPSIQEPSIELNQTDTENQPAGEHNSEMPIFPDFIADGTESEPELESESGSESELATESESEEIYSESLPHPTEQKNFYPMVPILLVGISSVAIILKSAGKK